MSDAQGDAGTRAEYWENFYQGREQVWSKDPNPLLVREVARLTPGTALDLGCGEGGDAVWLAGQGWQVTAVDVSDTALERAAALAEHQGVGASIGWQRHDLAETFPEGRFDLVSAQFFHSPVAIAQERDKVLRRAAEAVAPKGTLLIVGHGEWPSWVRDAPHEHDVPDIHFPTNSEVLTALGLAEGDWVVETDEAVLRDLTGPNRQNGTRNDIVLKLRRTT
ncbi:class I SAM-dependent methyltransferase [Nocardia panacis]|uniref:Class I SAM-dependent methyltransferase n=1 Tax=Nocardia panacis TaxID=2340916 RepID=A0A3A4KTV4_9NOCA|nr:class I SAM-dependent methyltransferase [Nocardia panacis]RJO79816.1 class I SAM-dependent methyltransferase [Nocardia panacis]